MNESSKPTDVAKPKKGRLPHHAQLNAFSAREAKELRFPYALISAAAALLVAVGVLQTGLDDPRLAAMKSLQYLSAAVTMTVFALIACFVVGFLLGTAFGTLKSAVVKLAAAIMFSLAVGLLCSLYSSFLGAASAAILATGLLRTFFDLEIEELIALLVAQALVVAGVRNLITMLPELV